MDYQTDQRELSGPPLARIAGSRFPANAYAEYIPTSGLTSSDDLDETDSGNILQYWRMLVRNKKLILLVSLAFMFFGYILGFSMKPVYRAQTMLEVLSVNEDFMNMKQSNPISTNGDYSDDISEEQTQARLLQGAALRKRVSAKLLQEAQSSAHLAETTNRGWRALLHLPSQTESREVLIDKAIGSLKVRPTGRTRLLEVTADSTRPEFAAQFLNTLTEEFIQQNMEARMNDTRRTGDWLRREIEDARMRLKASEDALQHYAHESGLIFTDENTNVATEKLQQVQQELSASSADRIGKQSRFELAKSSPPDSLADVLNDPGLRETNSKIKDLQRQIAELSAIYNPGYQKLKQLQAELTTLQSVFEHDRRDILNRIETDYQESLRRERLLADAYTKQVREVSGQDEKGIQYNILKREVDSNRQLYDSMLQQTKQASVASAMRASNVRVVDQADRPISPVLPNFPLNSAAGLILGLLGSIAFVIMREKIDRTLQDPGETQLWTHLPDLGTIPSANIDRSRIYASQRVPAKIIQADMAFEQFANAAYELDEAPSAIGLPAAGKEKAGILNPINRKNQLSFVAESFRSVLTSILVAGDDATSPTTLLLTSANAAEGKTTIVSNLGIAMAEIGRKVLIIDADLRRPRIHSLFGLPNERGLTDLLRTKQSPEDACAGIIQATRIDGLYILPSGPPTNAAANLLYSPNLKKLVTSLKSHYDMILIDSPPMHMTDARVTARFADAVIIVARAGKTTRDALIAAAQRLKEDRIRVLGTILNDWNPKDSRGGYYYGGRYYGSDGSYRQANYPAQQ